MSGIFTTIMNIPTTIADTIVDTVCSPDFIGWATIIFSCIFYKFYLGQLEAATPAPRPRRRVQAPPAPQPDTGRRALPPLFRAPTQYVKRAPNKPSPSDNRTKLRVPDDHELEKRLRKLFPLVSDNDIHRALSHARSSVARRLPPMLYDEFSQFLNDLAMGRPITSGPPAPGPLDGRTLRLIISILERENA
ncbi:hypothetical protein B0T21DRAFT_351392 [Apiosordaria backusii]|uniref:Uncharacterized protein n=1 Tax=Apiosordaria backusii TaxID=314023 RepID=A0AA40ASY9_9PEZI|nr:hypothetical protein B0T21DRAFT_351392 [Apiosordaria backusii]